MFIQIHPALLSASMGKLSLGIVLSKVKVSSSNDELWGRMTSESSRIKQLLDTIPSLADLPAIKALTSTYKNLGLKLSDYKGSNEALLKRVKAGNELYRINPVVDANNLLSITSQRSVGSYDLSKLSGNIIFRAGAAGETYMGTTQRPLKLENLPVLSDDDGKTPFGSPTSDSKRALISEETTDLVTIIFSFDGEEKLDEQLAQMADLLKLYANATDVKCMVVKGEAKVELITQSRPAVSAVAAASGLEAVVPETKANLEKEEEQEEAASSFAP